MNVKVKRMFFETFLVIETDQGYKIFEEVVLDKSGLRQGLGGLMVSEANKPPPLTDAEKKTVTDYNQNRVYDAVAQLTQDMAKTKRYAF